MPSDTAITIGQEGLELTGITAAMNQVYLGVSLWGTASRVNVMTAEIAPEIQSFLDGQVSKVLVSEGDDFALGNEQGELILAGGRELAELNTSNF